MILGINTASLDQIVITLSDDNNHQVKTKKIKAPRQQAEKLLPGVANLLKQKNITLRQIKKIQVVSSGGSFTSLRIGVITANALAYALNISIEAIDVDGNVLAKQNLKNFARYKIVSPQYDQEPNIGVSKKKFN